jgi:regulator of replication initiation timing
MHPAIIGSALLGVSSSIFNSILGNSAHNKDRQEALDDWNRQNEYNSPKAQMQRYKDAGLNPQLIYGQGTPGNAPATPVSSQKSGAYAPKLDLQEIYGEAKRLEMNMQQTQQSVENLKTNQELMKTSIDLNNQLQQQRGQLQPFKLDEADARINSLNSSSQWRNALLEPTIANMDTNRNVLGHRDAREERMLKSNLNVNNSRIEQMQAQTALTLQLKSKAAFDTAISQAKSNNEVRFLEAIQQKLYAETNNIIQGRSTSLSIQQLNEARLALTQYEQGSRPYNDFLNTISSLLKFKR